MHALTRGELVGRLSHGGEEMCESTAFLLKDGKEEKLLEDVVLLKPEGNKIILKSILGETQEIEAVVDHIDLMEHKIVLRK
jgi:predicted RNA-binding protein